jgi:hypothetical protein
MVGYAVVLMSIVCGSVYLGATYVWPVVMLKTSAAVRTVSSATPNVTLTAVQSTTPVATSASQVTGATEVASTATTSDPIIDEYLHSGFRLLRVVKDEKANVFLVVATKRSQVCQGNGGPASLCDNDTACGSIYTQPTCYFFTEPDYVYNVDPHAKFIYKNPETIGAVDAATQFTFPDDHSVRFEAGEGDAGYAVQYTYSLDLKTGKLTVLSKKEFGP